MAKALSRWQGNVGCLAAFVWCFIGTTWLRAQEEIETDRDSFTRSPRVVERGWTVMEGSYTILTNSGGPNGYIYPDFLARVGANDWLELRIGWNYEDGKSLTGPAVEEGEEEGIINYGAKLLLTKASGWLPDSSLILTGYSPTSGPSNDTDFSLEYAVGWKAERGYEFDMGLRWIALAEEEDHFQEWAPSAVFKMPVFSDRLNAHVEYFSLNSVQREDDYGRAYAGPGIHYLLTRNMEIGTRVFWGMNRDAADFIANAGLGIRF